MSDSKRPRASVLALTGALGVMGCAVWLAGPAARGQGQGGAVPVIEKAVHELPLKALGRTFVVFSPDGKLLATAGARTVKLWDPATGKELRSLEDKGAGWVNALAFAPDGKTLAAVGDDNTIRLWDPTTGAIRRRLEMPDLVFDAVSYSPDGKILAAVPRAAGGGRGGICLFDAASGKELRRFGGGGLGGARFWMTASPFSPNSKLLATAGTGTTVQLWDPAKGGFFEVRRLEVIVRKDGGGPLDNRPRRLTLVMALAFAPDGRTLAVGDCEGKVTFWDPATGKKRAELTALPPERLGLFGVSTLAYSPDGRTLASGGSDGMIHLWETASRTERLRLRGHGEQVWSVAIAPDSRTLASSGTDAIARIWDVAPRGAAR
jgi:WD40 repeat protein